MNIKELIESQEELFLEPKEMILFFGECINVFKLANDNDHKAKEEYEKTLKKILGIAKNRNFHNKPSLIKSINPDPDSKDISMNFSIFFTYFTGLIKEDHLKIHHLAISLIFYLNFGYCVDYNFEDLKVE